MGTINRQANGSYYARWRTPDGKSRKKAFARKRDAETYLSKVEGTKATGSYIDPSRAKLVNAGRTLTPCRRLNVDPLRG